MTVPCRGLFRALCALVGCTALLALARRDMPVWDLSNPDAADEHRRGAVLEANRQRALARHRTQVAISQALAEGRLPLLKAAARLRECERSAPSFRWDVFRTLYPGASDEERFCRKAIDYAVKLLHAQPERARAVQPRLEAELSTALRHGPLRLCCPR